MNGHTCLAVPVPALEDWVRERTAHYDPSFVSTDPGFAHAHLTLLAPWVERPTAADLRRVERVLLEVRLRSGLPLDVLDEAGRAAVQDAVARGLGEVHDERLVLTLRGRLLADAVVRDLLG